jgi:hypothetical protein
VIFKLHTSDLARMSDGFPPAEFGTTKEPVCLEERSEVLEKLFLFLYPRMAQPRLDRPSTPFDLLLDIANAAEKYQVFWAMHLCSVRME